MIWNDHSKLEGKHAFLSASKYSWVNYDEDKLIESRNNFLAAAQGTELHALAAQCIKLGVKLQKTNATLNLYVNDAIGYKMTPERILYYSPYCFGTADAISFRKNMLRIHDLKTGVVPAHMEQLEIYAALFCLEYKKNPADLEMELRIYQNNQVMIHNPEPERIKYIMDKAIRFSDIITKQEGGVI